MELTRASVRRAPHVAIFQAARCIGLTCSIAIMMSAVVLAAPATKAFTPSSSACVSQAQRLHELPSKPSRHIAHILQLKENSWLSLGPPSPEIGCGEPRGRPWTSKMAYAPDLHGAFLFGSGKHGSYNRETDRYEDDLWFYDSLAHRWIVVHPGTRVSKPDLIVNTEGFVATSSGQPVPVAPMVHGYEMTTYDTELARFMSVDCPGDYWHKTLTKTVDLVTESQKKLRGHGLSPWMFDTKTLQWGRSKTATKSPRSKSGCSGAVLIYLPSIKKVFFRWKKNVWIYDPAANEWTRTRPAGPPPPFGIEATACYDPKRDRIYIGGGIFPIASGNNALWIYDVQDNRWIDPKPTGVVANNQFSHNVAMMHCDLANDVVIVTRHKGGPDRGIFVYDPKDNAWTVASRSFPEMWPENSSTRAANGYYDIGLNAHFYHVAANSEDNGVIFVYRYKGTP